MRSFPFILLALMVVAVLNVGCSHPFTPTKPVKIDTNFGTIKTMGNRVILKVKL